ncbi:MAG TPA: DUF58 domain-containing protein [Gemmataceae bacterium]|nr:DUF58 domain-containing protein [Gemmataceae bacterium]
MSKTTTEPIELPPKVPTGSQLEGHEGLLWLTAAAVLLFIGILKGINLVIVLAYVLLGLWAINLMLARRATGGLSARRQPRPPVTAGVPTEWAVTVTDAGPVGGNWILEETAGGRSSRWLALRSGPATFTVRPRFTIPTRGKHTLAPLTAHSTFPFGLWTRTVKLLPAEEFIVLPQPARVDGERLRHWLFRRRAGHDAETRTVRRVVEREAEIHGLRDYRVGDAPRRIHWKATARRNRLMVREYEDAGPPRLLLVVEPYLPATPTADDRVRLESTISLAAGVVREWRRDAGARLALVIAGPTPMVLDGPPGPGPTERMLEALAVEPGGPPGNVREVLGRLSRATLAAPTLIVSARPDSAVAAAVRERTDAFVAVSHPARNEGWFQLS